MVTEEKLISSIKRKHRGKVFSFIVAIEEVIIFVLMGTIFTLIVDGFIFIKFLKPEIQDAKDVMRDPVFRAFRNPSNLVRIINEIESSEAIYEQGTTKMTEDYLIDKKDYRTVVRLSDVVKVSIGMDPHNTDGCALFVSDKHNRTCYYTITGDRNAARHLGNLVEKHCPNLEGQHHFEEQSEVVKL